MGFLNKDTFICLDCETTGLEPKTDRIIEIAVVKFTFSEILESFETLIDPEISISDASIAIHHITTDMVLGKPKIKDVLSKIIDMIDSHVVIGHGIQMDLAFLAEAAARCNIAHPFHALISINTLRLARLYGESPTNSLEMLRQHFNIEAEGAHRAMNDVSVNIRVFKYLSQNFKTTDQILTRLKKPILLKKWPLGKYKGQPFNTIPDEYLKRSLRMDFDEDLLFSIRVELQKRSQGNRFEQAANPFSQL